MTTEKKIERIKTKIALVYTGLILCLGILMADCGLGRVLGPSAFVIQLLQLSLLGYYFRLRMQLDIIRKANSRKHPMHLLYGPTRRAHRKTRVGARDKADVANRLRYYP